MPDINKYRSQEDLEAANMSDAKQREAELMFLRAENQHLKSDNKELRTKIRSISQEKKEEAGA